MIYSKWLPDRGGYAYYDAAAERRGLGDDLPTPRLKDTSSIGVASTDIGRAMPLGAKIVGYGPVAKGSIAPFDRSGLSGFTDGSPTSLLMLGALVLVGAAVGTVAVRRLTKA